MRKINFTKFVLADLIAVSIVLSSCGITRKDTTVKSSAEKETKTENISKLDLEKLNKKIIDTDSTEMDFIMSKMSEKKVLDLQ